MVNAVGFDDIAFMLDIIVKGFQDYIFFGFVLMCTFSVLVFVKTLFIGGRL